MKFYPSYTGTDEAILEASLTTTMHSINPFEAYAWILNYNQLNKKAFPEPFIFDNKPFVGVAWDNSTRQRGMFFKDNSWYPIRNRIPYDEGIWLAIKYGNICAI